MTSRTTHNDFKQQSLSQKEGKKEEKEERANAGSSSFSVAIVSRPSDDALWPALFGSSHLTQIAYFSFDLQTQRN